MKNNIVKMVVGTVSIFLIISILSFSLVFAQNESKSEGGGRLEGTWDAQVSITNCQNGDVLLTFASIASFMQGGTSVGSTGGVPQSLRTPEHGVWGHLRGNSYAFRFKSFNFNAQNAPTGWTIVQHEVTLDSSGDTYTSSGTAEFYNQSGVLIGRGCSTAVGTRFEL